VVPDFAWPAMKQARWSNGSLEITSRDYNSYSRNDNRSKRSQSGRALPHSKTSPQILPAFRACVLDCGAAAPL
jgi:hypothetical protein